MNDFDAALLARVGFRQRATSSQTRDYTDPRWERRRLRPSLADHTCAAMREDGQLGGREAMILTNGTGLKLESGRNMIPAESTSVGSPDSGFMLVEHEQIADGLDMGGTLWFARGNLPWVIQTLNACLTTYGFPRTEERHGDDSFRVFEAGPEQAPYVHLMNRRDKAVPHGGVYALQVSKPVAKALLQQLVAL